MRRRLVLVLALVFALVGTGAARWPQSSGAQPLDTKIDVVRATYDLLLDLFYDPLEPGELLTAAWADMGGQLRQANRPAPPSVGELPGGREEAFAAFAARYRAYVSAPRLASRRPMLPSRWRAVWPAPPAIRGIRSSSTRRSSARGSPSPPPASCRRVSASPRAPDRRDW